MSVRAAAPGSLPCACAVLLAAALAPAQARADEPAGFTIAPRPAWVTPLEADTARALPQDGARDGVHELLIARQVRVEGAEVERYYHLARKIISSGGVEEASNLHFDFDPPHQKLVLHRIRLLRGGQALDALKPKEIHVVQRESDLSRSIYNGTMTAISFLRDVRAGDVVDYEFSLRGANPVFGQRFAQTTRLALSIPVQRLHYRVLAGAGHDLFLKRHALAAPPQERLLEGAHEYVWDLADVPALEREHQTPGWFDPAPRVELSEYNSWADVAAWALPLYESRGPLSPALNDEIDRIRRASTEPQKRVVAALRFVQDQVRYLGIELGESSHKPAPPSTVVERRFGDCKDKSLLLTTMLRALGIEAHPALVNTSIGRGLDEVQPSPLAFDHVIVRVKLAGRDHWLDPTMSGQLGPLEEIANSSLERALVIAEGTTALSMIPLSIPDRPTVEELEEITAETYNGPVRVTITTTFRGDDASAKRRDIESVGREELARKYLNYQKQDDPSITAEAPLAITDDPERNTLTLVERYRSTGFWDQGSRLLRGSLIESVLPSVRDSFRKTPLAVNHPTYVAQEIRLSLPGPFEIPTGVRDATDNAITVQCNSSASDNTATVRCYYRTLRDFVPTNEVEWHLRLLDRIHEALAYEVSLPLNRRTDDSESWIGLAFVGGVVLVAFTLVVGVNVLRGLPQRLRRRAFARKKELGRGEAAATAIPVGSREELERLLRRGKCACGASLDGATALELGVVVFDGREITAATLPCSACGQRRRRFFMIR